MGTQRLPEKRNTPVTTPQHVDYIDVLLSNPAGRLFIERLLSHAQNRITSAAQKGDFSPATIEHAHNTDDTNQSI